MNLPDTDSAATALGALDREGITISAEAFETIGRILKNLKGFNLDIYKDKCIKRRIAIRIRATHCATADEYCDLLLHRQDELDRLLKVLTIHVSQFFRNPPTFEKLKRDIIPALFSLCRQEGRSELKCWSVGCAGGEEPYSLALLFKETFSKEMEHTRVSILASDVDSLVLDHARRGEYPEERLQEVPSDTRKRWFAEEAGKYALLPEIKAMVEFRRSDLFDTSAFSESDLMLCRNVLIYFERQQQEKIVNSFANVLRPGGILVLGKSETLVGECRRRFLTICPVERIYRVT